MYELAKNDFSKWIKQLDQTSLSDYEKTIINIIYENFDEVVSKGTAGAARIRFLVGKIREKKFSTDTALSCKETTEKLSANRILRLQKLEIKTFRGFNSNLSFNFEKQNTVFYGPNGSGKSSLCEALEYSLLGTIREAETRNIPITEFIKNKESDSEQDPALTCIYSDGTKGMAVPRINDYYFSFIEKNRIDSFSHISATTRKEESDRLASLFGLSDFYEFVNGFTETFDDRYIQLDHPIKDAFDKIKIKYDADKKNLENNRNKQRSLLSEITEKIEELHVDTVKNYDSALNYLRLPDGSGKIAELEALKAESMLPIYTTDWIGQAKKYFDIIKAAHEQYKADSNTLIRMSVNSDLHDLYMTIDKLSETQPKDICPACLTPITRTVTNPFVHASEELKKLSAYDSLKGKISNSLDVIEQNIPLFNTKIKENSEIFHVIESNSEELIFDVIKKETFNNDIKHEDNLTSTIKNVSSFFQGIDEYLKKIVAYNEDATNKNNGNIYIAELEKYNGIYNKLIELNGAYKTITDQVTAAEKLIKEFDAQLQQKQEEIKKESGEIDYNQKIIEAYQKVRHLLNSYKENLPATLSKNLSDKVTEYYNIMNEGDAGFEKVIHFSLPTTENDKILVRLNDGIEANALQILSEGHVKLLGLAILLAKAHQDHQQFLIFDDIVNAIDDDHRDGVAEMLLKQNDFTDIQMIITCHGEQFVKKLSEKIERADRDKVLSTYIFVRAETLPKRGITVDYANPTEFIDLAAKSYRINDLKDAAGKCRQATECLVNKLWKKISKSTDSALTVAVRGPNNTPDLYSVVDALIKKTSKMKFEEENNICTSFKQLKDDYNWMLLNKGTHVEEDQFEFEGVDIKKLIDLLILIEKQIQDFKIIVNIVGKSADMSK